MSGKKILRFLILLFTLHYSSLTSAGEITREEAIDIFFKANKEYNDAQKEMAAKKVKEALQKFTHAAQLYEKLLESNFINGQIYYNLGNAYYKLGMPGRAILQYRKAERLLPRNADIKANIGLLKSDFKDKEAMHQVPEILKIVFFWYFFLNLNEITNIAIYMYLVFMASILSVIVIRLQWLKRISIITASCLLVLIVSIGLKAHNQYSIERGVVIADECNIRYGPGEEYEPKFKIHEGAEVKIEEARNKWYKVYVYVDVEGICDEEHKKDTEFRKGWIPKANVEKI